jgi:hypothetical protein
VDAYDALGGGAEGGGGGGDAAARHEFQGVMNSAFFSKMIR